MFTLGLLCCPARCDNSSHSYPYEKKQKITNFWLFFADVDCTALLSVCLSLSVCTMILPVAGCRSGVIRS